MAPVEYSTELVQSVERLNVFFHIHHLNEDIMNNVGRLMDKLKENPEQTMAPEALFVWLQRMGDNTQTIDALMHIAQNEFTGPEASEWLESHSDQEAIEMRDGIESPILSKMMGILTETGEERTQRILLEILNVHE